MTTTVERIGVPSGWTTEYWLGHCEGYRVFTDEGPIGFVEEVLWEAGDEPYALLARVSEAFGRVLIVRIAAVEGFDPARERLFIGPLAGLDRKIPEHQLMIPAAT